MARIFPDTLTHDGAYRLAETIRGYWARRGYYPIINVVENFIPSAPSDRERSIWVVRSNMIGGKP